ncbi:hypothetical protein ACROYT_G017804 [Oculina patagonica]
MASVADAEETLRSTNAKANFQRLTRLLMCGGLRLLRETFDSIHKPADLPLKLSDPAIQTQLRGARLTRPECACLYPSTGLYGKSSDFDITLIFRLLRTICNLTPPPGPRGWDDLPNSSDHSLEADLVRIKYYRNEVYGHSKTMEISDAKFTGLWKKISECLIRIAASISHAKKDEWKKAIDEFLVNPLTPEEERYVEELDKWYKQDMDVKIEVEKLGDTIKTLKEDMKEGHDSIQEEVRSFRQEMEQTNRPVYMAGPVVIQIQLNISEGITKAGLPFRPQLLETVGSERMCTSIPDQEQAAGVEDSDFEELQLNPLDPPTELQMWNVILSFKKSFELFLQYLGYKLNVFVRGHDVGSLLINVEYSSLQVLEGLWKDYSSGHLNEIAQEMLVTAEVLEKLGVNEVKLKTFISEDEYDNGRQIFMTNPDPQGRQMRGVEQQLSNAQGQLRGIEEMKQFLLLLHKQLNFKNQQLTELEQQVTNLQGRLREKEEELVDLEEKLRFKDKEVNDLKTTGQEQREHQHQPSPDWVISRDQIQLTDKLLGRGGWSVVVEGKYCGCAVAVKQLHELILSPHNRSLFEREMDIASRCRHPCLLQFIGGTNDEGSPLFVTELMESSLRALLEQRPLSAKEVFVVSLDVARALSYLHQKKPPILHRDISSANVLLWRQGDQWRGKVSLGMSATYSVKRRMSIGPGSVIYSAPETLTSNQTFKVDVYSFGVLLCEMCIRELPDPERRDQQIAMVMNRVLRTLIQSCVQTEPETRPNMEVIIEELELEL